MSGTELVVARRAGALVAVGKKRSALVRTNGRAGSRKNRRKPPRSKVSRQRKPDDMTLEVWQLTLRREFGRKQKFRWKNVGGGSIFSEYEVTNPETRRTYRIAIRGARPGDNYCSCPDFAVNTLGSCKHIEFVLSRLERVPGARAALRAGYHPPFSEIYVRYGARREVCFRPGKGCPEKLLRLAGRYFDRHGRLRPEAVGAIEKLVHGASELGHDLRCYEDALGLIAQVRDRATLARRVERLLPRGAGDAAFRSLIRTRLYPYQRKGALFLAGAGRALLADDMGLGKTIQALAATEILARAMGVERVLIVCPTSLKHQWKREIEKFTRREALVVEGLAPRRAASYAAPAFFKITNYDVIHRDAAQIRAWQPELVILDEAQRIKNWKTRAARSVKQLESPYAFVLTGTPLENRLEELYSIVEFVDRFRLGPMFRFLHEHQHVDDHGRVVGYHDLSGISETLEPILLRRKKDKVLQELPERLEKRLFVPMTDEQMRLHDENRELVARIVAKWRRYGFLSESDQRRLMIFLQNMRMSCDSTYLLDPKTDHGVKADEITQVLSEIFEQPQAKAVVFSQWLRMHELVRQRVKENGWGHVLFHGGVPGKQRKHLVDRFREDKECRLFLATDAGGVGLNLQNASVVVNLDLPWNPAVLEQRIGRVHRLGQQSPVLVVNLISKGTIEEGMLALLGFKTAMFSGVLDGGQDEVFLGGSRLKRFMESVEKVTSSISDPMPVEPPPSVEESEAVEGGPTESEPQAATRTVAPAEQAWSEVLSAGVSLLEKLTQAVAQPGKDAPSGFRLPPTLVAQDDRTGQPFLKLPLPAPDTVERILQLFGSLLKR